MNEECGMMNGESFASFTPNEIAGARLMAGVFVE
jgi:hypothetical protein